MHVCMHTYACICNIYIYIYTRICIYAYIYIYIYVYIYIYMCMCYFSSPEATPLVGVCLVCRYKPQFAHVSRTCVHVNAYSNVRGDMFVSAHATEDRRTLSGTSARNQLNKRNHPIARDNPEKTKKTKAHKPRNEHISRDSHNKPKTKDFDTSQKSETSIFLETVQKN